ncbi:hypothetical protein BDQ17DRAFT_1332643 [Cyathus striatus]|nr:hypothetical protein BDQ17DRAFT_1332643 [Cyathus striatus]
MDPTDTSVQLTRLLRYTQLIAALVTIYDHLCTVDYESKPWTSSKISFVLTRYIGDLFVILQKLLTYYVENLVFFFPSVIEDSCLDAQRILPWVTLLLLYLSQCSCFLLGFK